MRLSCFLKSYVGKTTIISVEAAIATRSTESADNGSGVYVVNIHSIIFRVDGLTTKHHGISKEKFPLYLKEMEFRYNTRKKSIFKLLASY